MAAISGMFYANGLALIGLLLGGLVYVGLLWGLRAFNAQERAVLRPLLQRV